MDVSSRIDTENRSSDACVMENRGNECSTAATSFGQLDEADIDRPSASGEEERLCPDLESSNNLTAVSEVVCVDDNEASAEKMLTEEHKSSGKDTHSIDVEASEDNFNSNTTNQTSEVDELEDCDSFSNHADGSDEEFEGLSRANRAYKPFRTEDSMTHTNHHLSRAAASAAASVASSTMDPELVKRKVRGQLRKQQMVQKARRIRKSGEASLMTKLRRENQLDINDSLSSIWY